VQNVFREVFDDDELQISRATTSADVLGWDSLMHVSLLVRLEAVFDIRFRSTEVSGLTNVGQLVDLISPLSRK
jgi:acyl carrier protein